MIVIVEEEVREIAGAMVTGAIRTSIGPFASEGLDEALGFAVGLRAIRLGEEMSEVEGVAGAGEVLKARRLWRRPCLSRLPDSRNAVDTDFLFLDNQLSH